MSLLSKQMTHLVFAIAIAIDLVTNITIHTCTLRSRHNIGCVTYIYVLHYLYQYFPLHIIQCFNIKSNPILFDHCPNTKLRSINDHCPELSFVGINEFALCPKTYPKAVHPMYFNALSLYPHVAV
jgi:hypothetical protein